MTTPKRRAERVLKALIWLSLALWLVTAATATAYPVVFWISALMSVATTVAIALQEQKVRAFGPPYFWQRHEKK